MRKCMVDSGGVSVRETVIHLSSQNWQLGWKILPFQQKGVNQFFQPLLLSYLCTGFRIKVCEWAEYRTPTPIGTIPVW